MSINPDTDRPRDPSCQSDRISYSSGQERDTYNRLAITCFIFFFLLLLLSLPSPKLLLPRDSIPHQLPCMQAFLSTRLTVVLRQQVAENLFAKPFQVSHIPCPSTCVVLVCGQTLVGQFSVSLGPLCHSITRASTAGRFTSGCHSCTRVASDLTPNLCRLHPKLNLLTAG